MTSESLDPGTKLWLARKGISSDDDINRVQEIAGTLTRGLYWPCMFFQEPE
jgi:hypothetical protein